MTEVALKGKKVIFFAPKFFGYEKEILHEMELLGAEVSLYSQFPSEHPLIKGAFRLLPRVAWRYSDRYFFPEFKNNGPPTCDVIFILKGEGLSPAFLKRLKERYPGTPIILYLWDSLINCRHIRLKFPYIDFIYSFDLDDCKRSANFKYRPLFFLDKYLKRENEKTGQGIFFVGTLNGDRPKVISSLLKSLKPDINFQYWLFVRSRAEFALRKTYDSGLRQLEDSRFIFTPMPAENITRYINESAAVLDIEYPGQSGLTMRTFEVLASGKKLITTNRTIAKYDFFNPTRICIIDRKNPVIPADFLAAPTPPLPEEFISRYSIRRWILEIMGAIHQPA